MPRQKRQRSSDASIAKDIAAKRKDFEASVNARQKDVDAHSKATKKESSAISKIEKDIDKRKKDLKALEKRLVQSRRALDKTRERAEKANADLAEAQSALERFNDQLTALVGAATPARRGRRGTGARKAATATAKRAPRKSGKRAARAPGAPTQREALLRALSPDRGMTVLQVIQVVQETLQMSIKKTSAGTTLSALKREGLVVNDLKDGWRLAKTPLSPSANEPQADGDAAPAAA